ncbi:MAG: hypothetical protein JOZ96_10720 [Acidobacteria bacterium]|nr:hypothetical protein [Acidobacteriota bacterium]
MKRLASRLTPLCLAAVFTLVFANVVANACARAIFADDRRGFMACNLTGSDSQWCYYDCSCEGNCNALYDQLGLEAY